VRATVAMALFALAAAARCGEVAMGRYVEKLGTVPDFYQADRAYGLLPLHGAAYCGPTAASNALVWLDQHGCGNLLDAEKPGPQDQFELIRLLGTADYMATHPVNGCGPAGIMDGIKRYCFERGYRALIEHAGWRTRHCRVADKPTIDWMLEGVRGTSNLLLNIGWYKTEDGGTTHTRLGGHYLTVVGYEAAGGRTWLIIHDPAKRNHPRQRNSVSRCPVKCLLSPLPAGTMLRKKVLAAIFAGDGLFTLQGIKLKKGRDLAIVDGAIAFRLLPR